MMLGGVRRCIWAYVIAVGEGSGASCVTQVLHLESVGWVEEVSSSGEDGKVAQSPWKSMTVGGGRGAGSGHMRPK